MEGTGDDLPFRQCGGGPVCVSGGLSSTVACELLEPADVCTPGRMSASEEGGGRRLVPSVSVPLTMKSKTSPEATASRLPLRFHWSNRSHGDPCLGKDEESRKQDCYD